jgi:hypothetical protein
VLGAGGAAEGDDRAPASANAMKIAWPGTAGTDDELVLLERSLMV